MKRSLIIVICATILVGCGGAQKRGEELMTSVTTYNDGVRWRRFAAAATQVPLAEREDFVDQRDDLADDLQISDWEIVKIKALGERRARVQVEYTWFLDSVGTVHETQAEQRWERHGDAWLIVEERFKKGEPMPGLADPPPDATDADPETDADPATDADGDEAAERRAAEGGPGHGHGHDPAASR